jgi:hypothetical protein
VTRARLAPVLRLGRLRVQFWEPPWALEFTRFFAKENPWWAWLLVLGPITFRWARLAGLSKDPAAHKE